MLRKLLIVGICAGSAASIPILYQADPETYHTLLERAVEPEQSLDPTGMRIDTVRPKTVLDAPGRKVQLASDARGHFTADFRMNGRKISALIDTGATLVALNVSTARRIGVKIAASDFKYTVETANGKTPAATAKIASVQIGRIAVDNVDAVILEDRALSDTLIGVSFLNRLGKYQVENGVLVMMQ